MADGRWRISVTAPDWGQDHLSPEAIVAFVDGELAAGPTPGPPSTCGQCPECAAQVYAQGQARAALRAADGPCLPSALLSTLRAIPQDADLPGPPPGLAMTADGELVSVLRPEAVAAESTADPRPNATRAPRRGPSAPARAPAAAVGTGVAVSGLALGALAFAAPAPPRSIPPPTPAVADRGVPGAVLGRSAARPSVLDARLQLGSPAPAAGRAGRTGADR